MNLSELIETHKGRRSYVELARDCGGVPSSKRLQQLVRESIKNFPDPQTVEALARGLRLPQRVVILSAAESLGLDVHDTSPRLMQLMPVGAQDLSEEQAAAVAHLVDVIVSDPLRQATEAPSASPDKREPTIAEVRAARRKAEEMSAAGDTVPDAVAAHEEEGSIAGEQEESDTP